MPMTKYVHFIWTGGGAPPKLDPLIKWTQSNPTLQAILWVDRKTLSSTSEYEKHGMTVKDINQVAPVGAPQSPDKIHYISEPEQTNYGAASDLLRYAALADLAGLRVDAPNNNDVFICSPPPYVTAVAKAIAAGQVSGKQE